MAPVLPPPDDPDYPQPGMAHSLVTFLCCLGLLAPLALLMLIIATRRALQIEMIFATPVGLLIALWPNLQAWRRRDLHSTQAAFWASGSCAVISALLSLTCFYAAEPMNLNPLYEWFHLTMAILLTADALFMKAWYRRIRKYRARVRLCPRCQYDLSVSIADGRPRCPECGTSIPLYKWQINAQVERTFGRKPWQPNDAPP